MNGRSELQLLPEVIWDRCRGSLSLLHPMTLLCVGIKQRGTIFLSVFFPFTSASYLCRTTSISHTKAVSQVQLLLPGVIQNQAWLTCKKQSLLYGRPIKVTNKKLVDFNGENALMSRH